MARVLLLLKKTLETDTSDGLSNVSDSYQSKLHDILAKDHFRIYKNEEKTFQHIKQGAVAIYSEVSASGYDVCCSADIQASHHHE